MAPSDPGVRATQVGGFIFVAWELRYNALQVQAEKAGISRIAGLLMGKILVFLHFPPARRNPPPYGTPYTPSPDTVTLTNRTRPHLFVVNC